MRITGSIPIHIARAYGVSTTPATTPMQGLSSIASASRPDPVDSFSPTNSVQQLVAAKVNQAVDFNVPAITPTNSDVLQLYTRAADKIEAAVSIQVGRSFDVSA